MKILLINGPNINMLGIREPAVYGRESYFDLLHLVQKRAKELDVELECFQSNHEGAIVDKIQSAYGQFQGIIINPAAYTHTSIAILDALWRFISPTPWPGRNFATFPMRVLPAKRPFAATAYRDMWKPWNI